MKLFSITLMGLALAFLSTVRSQSPPNEESDSELLEPGEVVIQTPSNCVASNCGSVNKGCASGARDELLGRSGCLLNDDGTYSGSFVWNGGIMEAWYQLTPCAARFETSESTPARIECPTLAKALEFTISTCFVNSDTNGIGLRTVIAPSGFSLNITISTCAGSWNKRRQEERRSLMGLTYMRRNQEIYGVIQHLLQHDDIGVDGKTVFTFPYSLSPSMTVCELAEESVELGDKYGC